MMKKISTGRRLFGREILRMAARAVEGFQAGMKEVEARQLAGKDYFASFENCYPLVNEAAPFLEEEARKMKMPPEEWSREELARKLFSSDDASRVGHAPDKKEEQWK